MGHQFRGCGGSERAPFGAAVVVEVQHVISLDTVLGRPFVHSMLANTSWESAVHYLPWGPESGWALPSGSSQSLREDRRGADPPAPACKCKALWEVQVPYLCPEGVWAPVTPVLCCQCCRSSARSRGLGKGTHSGLQRLFPPFSAPQAGFVEDRAEEPGGRAPSRLQTNTALGPGGWAPGSTGL